MATGHISDTVLFPLLESPCSLSSGRRIWSELTLSSEGLDLDSLWLPAFETHSHVNTSLHA